MFAGKETYAGTKGQPLLADPRYGAAPTPYGTMCKHTLSLHYSVCSHPVNLKSMCSH